MIRNICLVSIVLILSVGAYTTPKREKEANEYLRQLGYRAIKFRGYTSYLCEDSNTYKVDFIALSKRREYVEGAICFSYPLGYRVKLDTQKRGRF